MTYRSPVVAILGHVDHGKTTLLDYIRKSNITAKETGGITQKIGAYEIQTGIKGYPTNTITFIDTPGHEAFSQLRSRGAQAADLALLVIDAKDSLMPQTIESISHIKAAKIPFIVVVNKIDLPEANPDKVKTDLLKQAVVVEEKGGKVLCLPISAKTGKGVAELLETILILAADLNLSYSPINPPKGYIIEVKKDKQGIAATVILKDGKIIVGDLIFAEDKRAKIRAIVDDRGRSLDKILPSTPAEIYGFNDLPAVGAVITDAAQAKIKQTPPPSTKKITDLQSILEEKPKEKKLALIIKADSSGSLEALDNFIAKNSQLEITLKSVGDINKSDVFLAKTTNSIIVGYNAKLNLQIKDLAKQEGVIIKTYNIIYELVEELTEVNKLMKEKEEKPKNYKSEAKILATFIIEKEKIFGVKIIKGKINLGDSLEVYRNNKLLGKAKLASLQIKAKKVNEAKKNQEAGMIFSPSLDIHIGDVIKFGL